MRIAGVGVNEKNPPTEETIIKHALNTAEYRYKKDAIKLIKAEIKASGLYRKITVKAKNTKKISKLNVPKKSGADSI